MNSITKTSPGLVITIIGPSGTGKNTVSEELMRRDPTIQYFVTATTRKPRAFEENGIDYFFITKEEFEQKLDDGEILEWNEFLGNYYGTLKEELENKILQGVTPLSDVSWSGAQSIRGYRPENTLCILLFPPSLEALDERMNKRRKTSAEKSGRQQERLEKIREDMKHIKNPDYVFTNGDMHGSTLTDYDYIVINDDVDRVVSELQEIITNERNKRG